MKLEVCAVLIFFSRPGKYNRQYDVYVVCSTTESSIKNLRRNCDSVIMSHTETEIQRNKGVFSIELIVVQGAENGLLFFPSLYSWF